VNRSDWLVALGLAALASVFFLVAFWLRDDNSGTWGGVGDGTLVGGGLFLVALIVWVVTALVQANRRSDR
jgi:hypothetical protein